MNSISWGSRNGIKCVILAAGRGTRLTDISGERPKVLMDINGKPILHHVIKYWEKYADEFVFVVGHLKEAVIEYVSGLPIKASFVEQKEPKGIANAVLQTERLAGKRFIVALGDCVCVGDFHIPPDMQQGIGICEARSDYEIRKSYSVELEGDRIARVVEKPKTLVNNLCGMGYYFFTDRVFKYIAMTPPSSLRNEVEITDVIQTMIDHGERISPVSFNGVYINVNFPEDVDELRKAL